MGPSGHREEKVQGLLVDKWRTAMWQKSRNRTEKDRNQDPTTYTIMKVTNCQPDMIER